MRTKIIVTVLTVSFVGSGCALFGLVGSPSASEKKIPAEFNISDRAGETILILVNQPVWGEVPSNLKPLLTEDTGKLLTEKTGFSPDQLVLYSALATFRSQRADFHTLSPVEVGAGLKAKLVLLANIQEYKLYELPASGYYKGSVSVRSVLFDVPTGVQVWPDSDDGKYIKVAFEAESGGPQDLAEKLSKTAAHCIVRYFYDCPSNEFKIWGEQPNLEWQQW